MRLLLLTALTMTAFAANSVLNRMAVGTGLIGPVDFAVIRLLAGAGMLGALVGLRALAGRGAVWPGTRGRVAGSLSLLVYLFGFSFAYLALDAGSGALILFGMVQVTMFAGALALGERVPARRWVGAGMAFLGLVYLLTPGSGAGEVLLHSALMAAAGIGWGFYSLSARGARDPLGATAWNFILAVPVAGLVFAFAPADAVPATASGVLLSVISGAVTSGLGYALWYRVLPELGAARGAVAQLTVPVIALVGGMALLGEVLTLRFALSAILVLGGVAFAVRPARQA
ncbi:DMT family transporter [Defluviimonas salinarum]|uniref:DMT family transporter n=1 Tax=Defluviimonas salinarum TaxID=2992147 RepID=A0ABT3J514_9RHOB|nr:DMT family transporter [Defluviimonas salinarum]MCW3782741.1 DMT family transporter [Defluviimonas salinarum]